jgi:ribosomal protein S7
MGKKFLFEKILYFSFFLLKKKLSGCAIFFFFEVLEKIKPIVGIKLYKFQKRKIKRITAVPYIVRASLQYKKAIF